MRLTIFNSRKSHPETKRLQVFSAWVGAAIILILAAILAIESVRSSSAPDLVIRVVEEGMVSRQRQILLEIRNDGGRTAANVAVVARIDSADFRAVLDYVPARGKRHLVVLAPPEGAVVAAVENWTDP